MSNRKYVEDLYDGNYATYTPNGKDVELIEPVTGEYGCTYWICKDESLDYLVLCRTDDLERPYRI